MRNQSPTKQGKQQHFPDKNVSVVIEPSELVKWGFTQDTPVQTSSTSHVNIQLGCIYTTWLKGPNSDFLLSSGTDRIFTHAHVVRKKTHMESDIHRSDSGLIRHVEIKPI